MPDAPYYGGVLDAVLGPAREGPAPPPAPTGYYAPLLDSILNPHLADNPARQQAMKLERERASAAVEDSGPELFGLNRGDISRRMVPFGGTVKSTIEDEDYKSALKAAGEHKATDEELRTIARYDQEKARQASQGLQGEVARGVATIPAIIGEAELGPARFLKSPPGASFLNQTGRAAASGPLMPSLVVPEAEKRSIEQGGEAYDVKNLAPAAGMAVLQNAILGTIGRQTGQVPGGWAARTAAGGAVMPVEQAGADAVMSTIDKVLPEAYQTKTRYGAVGDLMRGDVDSFARKVTVQAVTGSAFASLHGRAANPAETIGPALDSLAKKGVPREKAAEAINDAVAGTVEPPTEAVQKHVEEMKVATAPPGEFVPVQARGEGGEYFRGEGQFSKVPEEAAHLASEPAAAEAMRALGNDAVPVKPGEVNGKPALTSPDLGEHRGIDQTDAGTMDAGQVARLGLSEWLIHAADRNGRNYVVRKGESNVVGIDYAEAWHPGNFRDPNAAVGPRQSDAVQKFGKGKVDLPESMIRDAIRRGPELERLAAEGTAALGPEAQAEAVSLVRQKIAYLESRLGKPTTLSHLPEFEGLKSEEMPSPKPSDPLAGIPDADQKALAKRLGLTVKGLRDRKNEPAIRAGIDRLRGKPPEIAPESPQPVVEQPVEGARRQLGETADNSEKTGLTRELPENAINATQRAPEPGVAAGPSEPPIVDSGASGRVARAPGELSEREQRVLDGLAVHGEDSGGQRVADELGISRERVRQIKNAALGKLGKTLAEYKAEAVEGKRNRALAMIERGETVDPSDLHNVPREAAKIVSARERKVMSDIEAETKHAKKIEALIQEIDRGGESIGPERRQAIFDEIARLQQAEESRSRPPRRKPPGVQEEGAVAGPQVGEGAAAPGPGGRPAVPTPGDAGGVPQAEPEGGAGRGGRAGPADLAGEPLPGRPRDVGTAKRLANLKQNRPISPVEAEERAAAKAHDDEVRKAKALTSLDRAIIDMGGLDPAIGGRRTGTALADVADIVTRTKSGERSKSGLTGALRELKLPLQLFRTKKKGGLDFQTLVDNLANEGHLPPEMKEDLAAAWDWIKDRKPSLRDIEAGGVELERMIAEHEKAQQEEADARAQALRSGHGKQAVEEAVRGGEEEADARIEAEEAAAVRGEHPADADTSFDPAEFGGVEPRPASSFVQDVQPDLFGGRTVRPKPNKPADQMSLIPKDVEIRAQTEEAAKKFEAMRQANNPAFPAPPASEAGFRGGIPGVPGMTIGPGGLPGRPPAEFAMARSEVTKEREGRGREAVAAAARRTNPQAWAAAEAKLAADPQAGEKLVDALAAEPRPITSDEGALLLQRRIALSNQHDAALVEYLRVRGSKVNEGGVLRDATAAELEPYRRAVQDTEAARDKLDAVTAAAGTQLGRGLQFFAQLAREDYTLGSMLRRAEAAKGGKLTKEEEATVAKQSEEIAKHSERLEKAESGEEPAAKAGQKGDITDLRIADQKAKQAAKETVTQLQASAQPVHKKVISGVAESASVVRTFITAYDLSAVLRQGAMLTYAHPLKAARVVPDMLKSFLDSHHFARTEDLIRHRENAGLYKQGQLYLADHLSAPEEAFLGKWVKRVPGVAASERAYTSFLNRMRVDVFDSMVGSMARAGKPTVPELKAIANYVNVSTGRGGLGAAEKAATVLAHVFFSPRYLASRIQVLAGQPFYNGTFRTRKLVAQEYARSLAGLAVFYAVSRALMPDSELSFDPRSSDFGKLKMGRFRVDPLAGFSQLVTLGARLVSGETKSTETGKVTALGGPQHKVGEQSTGEVVARFLRNKLAPVPGVVYDVLAREQDGGRPTTPEHLAGSVVPISVKDVYEAMTAGQGVPRGVALSLLAILGMGTQNYDRRDKQASKQEPVLPAFPSDQVQPRRPAGVR